jgi:hypothetical protein
MLSILGKYCGTYSSVDDEMKLGFSMPKYRADQTKTHIYNKTIYVSIYHQSTENNQSRTTHDREVILKVKN